VPHIFAGATQDLSNGSQACEPNHNYNRPRSVSAQQIIRQRRSAVAFDGETSISDQQFYRMMKRVVPSLCNMPWDSVTWPVRVHLCLFVHLVDGLAPGLYILVRDPNKRQNLQDLMKPEFEWARPESCPESLPLWFLLGADCRRAAAQLSLGQEIAGMSAFSLGMVAEFDATLEQEGAWAYRRLFWEAGMVGQVLYLEAEAAGIRATGIGAYFDDLVHDVFGLSDHRFQSMYHFTVGGPIDDERLTTLPAYPAQ
jgi:nitroreductase